MKVPRSEGPRECSLVRHQQIWFVLVNHCDLWIVLFSVPRDGNQGLENAIFRPRRTENKYLRWLFSVLGDVYLAYSMLFSVPRDGNHGLEKAIFRP